MQALQISAFGNPEDVVEVVDVPEPAAPGVGEVLLAVEYAPINPSELLMMRGRYGVRPPLPAGLGQEGVGRVLAVGEGVDDLRAGDRVLLPFSHRAWRERLVLPASKLLAVPEGADPRQLSMLGVNPPTAALLLSEFVDLRPGDWVIQNAGNSGVGRAVIAFARDRGLKTVSLVRREALVDELAAAGGDVVLVDGPDLPKRVADATGKAAIRLALDGVAGESLASLTGSLAPGGTLVQYSGMSGQPGLASPAHVIFKDLTVRGFWLEHPHIRTSPKVSEAIRAGARLIADGKLDVPVVATYPLTAAREAVLRAQQGGKVLFQPASLAA